jgi:hypothetical protein
MRQAPAPTPIPAEDAVAQLAAILLVVDTVAEYRGSRVTLSEQDQSAIAAVILKRAAANASEQLRILQGGKAKRTYTRAPAPEPTAPKKRGRPKKNAE